MTGGSLIKIKKGDEFLGLCVLIVVKFGLVSVFEY